jgi:hypothetical protein
VCVCSEREKRQDEVKTLLMTAVKTEGRARERERANGKGEGRERRRTCLCSDIDVCRSKHASTQHSHEKVTAGAEKKGK